MKPPPIPRSQRAARAAPAHAPLQQGFLVADKYGLIEPLGTGSMGAVWKASHVMLGHTVAIKFLHASVEAYPEGRVRFEREAKLSARLGETSRHICRVTDFGVIGSGTPFVVMEFLHGEELSARLKRERALPLPVVVDIVVQLCRALTVAHDAGVIHRDLKPANVFLCKAEEGDGVFVKLLDFGVAKAAMEHEDTQATRAGMVFGTPGYMSPEQILADGELDARADLWSVAVLAYRMIVGRTPFGAGSMSELGLRILTTQPPLPSSARPELPKAFDAWMKKGLAKRREERFATATELADALVAAASGASDSQPELLQAEAAQEIAPAGEDSTYGPLYRSEAAPRADPRAARRARLALVAGALFVSLILAVVIASRTGRLAPSPSSAAGPFMSEPPRSRAQVPTREAPGPDRSSDSLLPAGAGSAPADGGGAPSVAAPANSGAVSSAPTAVGSAPARPAAASRAVRARPSAAKEKARIEAVEKRANELWNKKDEL
jgi:serine/threonine-protein kinase